MGDEGQVASLVTRVLETFGRLDVAFNNAGSGHHPAPLADLDVSEFDEAIRVSLRGTPDRHEVRDPPMLAQGAAPSSTCRRAQGCRSARMGAYAAAKHGVIRRDEERRARLRREGDPHQCGAPGPILNNRIASLPPERREPIVRAVPLGRIGTPEDVAAAVVWLASDAAAFVTGTVVSVDGGRLAGA